jgi:repressor LexA
MENLPILTPLERKMLSYIQHHLNQHGQGPTLTEIGQALGIASKGTVHRYVQALVDKGYLLHTERGWRGIRLAKSSHSHATLPLVGRIAAGQPIEAIPGQDHLNLDDFLHDDHYALQVKGDSMCDIGILDNDMVIIKRQSNARNGDIVVALIDGLEVTLKRLQRLGDDQILLIAENSTLQPMQYAASRVEIQGVLVAQMRRY